MKKVISIFSAVLLIMSIALVSAFAFDKPKNYRGAYLHETMEYAESKAIHKRKQIRYCGWNGKNSHHSVRCEIRYSDGSKWRVIYHTNINAGNVMPMTSSPSQKKYGMWKTNLDPFGARMSHCKAASYVGD